MSTFTLPKLPYADDALAPVISANTISFHYGKHHKAYVDKLNELAAGTPYADMPLEEVVQKSAKDEKGKLVKRMDEVVDGQYQKYVVMPGGYIREHFFGADPELAEMVWEHAYYLDFQNRRPDHVQAWLDKLANWSFAEKNLD